jgi:serine/threonine protein kinase
MKLSNLVGQALDGKYRIEKQLGKGGMGAVFFATHLGTERPVAVKVIMPQYMKHDEFVERFRREARAAGRLRHPNVVDVTDFGFANVGDEEVAYLVMEYLDGCTLDEILEEEGKLPYSFTLDIIEQVCSAVEEAHQQGIIHRDLKPDNIWLEPNRRGSYTVKVLDFGIAKLEEVSLETENQTSSGDEAKNNNAITGKFSLIDSEDKGTLLFKSQTASSVSAYQESEFTEGATQIQSVLPATNAEELTEAETKEMSVVALAQSANSEAGTKRFDSVPTDPQNPHTSSASALTRAGSVLGTPLYMSPEQCGGKILDARSDVYSLGVISYQMLSGETPFKGEYQEVMKSHIDKQPPLLKVKGVRKKTSRVVMKALDKSPDNRPHSAAAFASILRANSEGVGALFQRALTLYSRHIQTFFKLALMIFAPLSIITILEVTNSVLVIEERINITLGIAFGAIFGLLKFIVSFATSAVLSAVAAWIVTGINAAPLRPIEIKPAFIALRKRIKSFTWTTILVALSIILVVVICMALYIPIALFKDYIGKTIGLILVIIITLGMIASMIVVMARYALAAPVTLLEGLNGRKALRRSAELTRRSYRTVITTVLINFAVPVLLTLLTTFIVNAVVKSFESPEQTLTTQQTSNVQNPESASEKVIRAKSDTKGFHLKLNDGDDNKGKRGKLVGSISQIVWLPAQVVLGMFAAIVTGLLYLKTRQAGGENIRDVSEDFTGCQERSKWQTKMRERLSLHTRTSKS